MSREQPGNREMLAELSFKLYSTPGPSGPWDNPGISRTAQGLGKGILHVFAGTAALQHRVFS